MSDTQPPAAPETDVRLTDAEQVMLVHAGNFLDEQIVAVERIVAERVRVVEGERDAARAEALRDAADEMEAVIADGDCAEVAAPVSGEVGRSTVVARRDALYEEPHTWLRERASKIAGGDIALLDAQCDADDLLSRLYLATARAESAEAAHEALRKGVEALADECDQRCERSEDRVLRFWTGRLRALAGGAR